MTDNKKILTLIVLYVSWFKWIILFGKDEDDEVEDDEVEDDEVEDDEVDSWSLSIIIYI